MARKLQAPTVEKQTFTMQLPRMLLAIIDDMAWEEKTTRTEIFKRILGGDTEVKSRFDRVAHSGRVLTHRA